MGREQTENDKKGTEVSATTRRAILLGGAVGLAGLVADSVISAQPASATQDSAVLLGEDNGGATARTGVFYTGNTVLGVLADGKSLYGVQGQDNSTGGGIGVLGQSTNGTAVYGIGPTGVLGSGTDYGVYGSDEGAFSNIAVAASLTNPANAAPALKAETGGRGNAVEATINNTANPSAAVSATTNGTGNAVSGSITNAANTQSAVVGSTNGRGFGTKGQGTNGATGVYGESDTGTGVAATSMSGDALHVVGRVAFSTSGLTTVAANKKTVNVIASVTTSSIILATLQTDVGSIAVANAVPASGSFRINLTAAPSRPVKVAWFVIG
jgi:hypothetical protein